MEKDHKVEELLADWRNLWPPHDTTKGVILTSLFVWVPGFHGSCYLANYLAEH